MKKISIVVPCYNEQETVDKFYDEAVKFLAKTDMDYEIIFVNDGSRDETEQKLDALAQKDSKVKVLSFSKNFGQQPAIICGFRHSTGDCVVELDCDLQDPIEVVLEMIEKWKEGYDVVHGRRRQRKGESFFKKWTAKQYYKFLSRICSFSIPRNTGDFKLLDRKVVDVICNLPEHEKYMRGLESWVGFKQTFVDFDRAERFAGETHYTLKKMVNLAKSGIISNSTYPLSLSFKFGMFFAITSFLAFITLLILACAHVYNNLTAWIFPTIGMTFGIGLILNAFTNIYIGKIYEEVKNRPEYIVAKKLNFDEEKKSD